MMKGGGSDGFYCRCGCRWDGRRVGGGGGGLILFRIFARLWDEGGGGGLLSWRGSHTELPATL
jgi:hypothetical protein